MSELTRVGDIELAQDLRFERRSRRVRKIAAVVFGLLLIAALLGVLGRSGPLSEASAGDGSELEVGYERFLRLDSPTELDLSLGARRGPTKIAISPAYLEGFKVLGFSVEPQSSEVEANKVVYVFEQKAPSQVTVMLEPEEIGFQHATVYGPEGTEVSFDQWVWP